MKNLKNDYEKASFFQKILRELATYNYKCGERSEYYITLRKHFRDNPCTKKLLPRWINENRNADQFWDFIKRYSTYDERRNFIKEEMNTLLEYCETTQDFPSEKYITDVLKKFDEENINQYWQRALQRKTTEPEGAITMARSLLESVCKHILNEKNIDYDSNNIGLSELYKKTATELNLSPSQHTEDIFKQILGGCSGIINGLGSLRNKLGDAHGTGKKPIKPAPRHAELAVNLSGAMALYLIETFNANQK